MPLRSVVMTTDAAVGADGVATGSTTLDFRGEIVSIFIKGYGSPPSTMDITLQEATAQGGENVLNLTNISADTKIYPRRQVQDNANSDIASYEPYLVDGVLTLTVAQVNAGDYIEALIKYFEY